MENNSFKTLEGFEVDSVTSLSMYSCILKWGVVGLTLLGLSRVLMAPQRLLLSATNARTFFGNSTHQTELSVGVVPVGNGRQNIQ